MAKTRAADQVHRRRHEVTTTELVKRAQSKSAKDRVSAISTLSGLGRYGERRAKKAIVKALRDSDPQVRRTAANAIVWAGDEEAVKRAIGDRRPEVRLAMVRAIGAGTGYPS